MSYILIRVLVSFSCNSASWTGPLNKTWDTDQCTQLNDLVSYRPEDCERACNINEWCNAFNYHNVTELGCNLLDCPIQVPPPATYIDDWEGYYEENGEETWRRCLS